MCAVTKRGIACMLAAAKGSSLLAIYSKFQRRKIGSVLVGAVAERLIL